MRPSANKRVSFNSFHIQASLNSPMAMMSFGNELFAAESVMPDEHLEECDLILIKN